ncbi:hypothetical protein HW276_06030 [Leptotrichia sp. oral taxon 417]|jgi:hypothetical protein|uniref:hypothetical protein n=1 Tax=Leptotrichia TaxID=32067 RepID=UPI0015BA2AB4|nr:MULTISPECIES: hypothetical protein [Leptotrichia]NWO27279.1 hypothetical protein [Leptotrichia sp. oral taxon 417]
MNFENLQKDLFERKLNLGEYFAKTFELLKVFLKENKLWFILLALGNAWLLFSNILMQHIGISLKIAESTGDNRGIIGALFSNFLVLFGIVIVSLGLGLLRVIIYMKSGYKIEGKEKEYRFENAFFKYLKYIGLYLLFVIAITVVVMILILITTILGIAINKATNSVFVGYTIIAIPIIIYIAIILAFILNTLYFFQIFYIRNIKVWESFKYNLKLSKKNRLRIIVPVIIIVLASLIFVVPFVFSVFDFMPIYVGFAASVICGFFSGILGVAGIIMNIVVFLNVEYDYLKKQAEIKNENNDDSELKSE